MRDLSILKEEIIYSLFEEEAEIIGESNLKDIVRGNVEFDYEESGHHLDITSTISLIASVGTIIDLGIKVYQKIYQKNKKRPFFDTSFSATITSSQNYNPMIS